MLFWGNGFTEPDSPETLADPRGDVMDTMKLKMGDAFGTLVLPPFA